MSDASAHPPTISRLSTGVPGLDTLLAGGLLAGGVSLVVGRPGTGKTILANQIAFHHVAQGGRVVYITLLTESHARMLAHLRSLSFFDPAPIADALTYISGYEALVDGGLDALRRLLRGVVRDQHATLLLIDGLLNAETSAPTPVAFNHFLQELQVFNTASGCTTLLLTTYTPASALQPEEAMVDAIFRLYNDLVGQRAVREVEIDKLRGSRSLRGRHTFQILEDGISIFPRTEVLLARPSADAEPRTERVPFGVPSLDVMLDGGLGAGSTTMLEGAAGSGKTSLGLQFLAAGLQQGQGCVFFGFYETPRRLRYKARQLGLVLEPQVNQGQLELLWYPPLEDNIDRLAGFLLAAIERSGAQRLFIDGLDGFRQCATHPERLPFFLTALMNETQARGVTTLYSLQTQELMDWSDSIPVSYVSALTENMIALRSVAAGAQVHRLLSIVKQRYNDHDPAAHEFWITDHGIDVAATATSAEAVLRRPNGSPNGGSSVTPSRKQGGRH